MSFATTWLHECSELTRATIVPSTSLDAGQPRRLDPDAAAWLIAGVLTDELLHRIRLELYSITSRSSIATILDRAECEDGSAGVDVNPVV